MQAIPHVLTPARLLLVLALTLVTLAGCEQRSDEPGATARGPTTHASPPDGMPPAPIAGSDREFLIEAAKTGLAGAEASQLVAERSTDLAEKNDELAHLAALKGLTLPAAPGADKGALVARLRGLGGAALDRTFLEELVSSHAAAIDLYEREAKGSEDPDMKAFAAKTLPLLREHQALTRQIAADRQES